MDSADATEATGDVCGYSCGKTDGHCPGRELKKSLVLGNLLDFVCLVLLGVAQSLSHRSYTS